ncbi:MAG: phosphotransferase [Nitrososphaera sp.]|nr:phosphotransferase [Nitrososphaera sp.]
MKRVSCLYWDDNQGDLERFKRYIERAWSENTTDVEIAVKPVSNVSEAQEILELDHSSYELFIADIVEGEAEGINTGLSLISLASSKSKALAIIALSIADRLRQDAIERGADEFVSKTRIFATGSLEFLGKSLLSCLRKHGHDPCPTESTILQYDKDSLALTALIQTIGEENVKSLALKMLKTSCRQMDAFFVRSGLSGASVLRLDCDGAGNILSILLKISRDEDQLKVELQRRDEAMKFFPPGRFVPFQLSDAVVESKGWYAIGTRFQPGASTLLDWLTSQRKPKKDVRHVMQVLLLGSSGLSEVYNEPQEHNDLRANTALWNVLSLSRRARIDLALEELSGLAVKHDREKSLNIFDVTLVKQFIKAKRIDNCNEEDVRLGTHLCRSHGDLHARNILVDGNGTPFLIDPANICFLHWAADVARLCVDLIVSGWDVGDSSHEWNNMGQWVEVCRALTNGTELKVNKDSENAKVWEALKYVSGNMSRIHDKNYGLTGEAEWKLALAVEFLRASYRQQDLPTPKRVLGLMAGCDALRGSCAEFERLR